MRARRLGARQISLHAMAAVPLVTSAPEERVHKRQQGPVPSSTLQTENMLLAQLQSASPSFASTVCSCIGAAAAECDTITRTAFSTSTALVTAYETTTVYATISYTVTRTILKTATTVRAYDPTVTTQVQTTSTANVGTRTVGANCLASCTPGTRTNSKSDFTHTLVASVHSLTCSNTAVGGTTTERSFRVVCDQQVGTDVAPIISAKDNVDACLQACVDDLKCGVWGFNGFTRECSLYEYPSYAVAAEVPGFAFGNYL